MKGTWVIFIIAVVGGLGYLAESRLLMGDEIGAHKNESAMQPLSMTFQVASTARYSVVIETFHEDGKKANLALAWSISTAWGDTLVKNRERTPKSGTRYVSFEPKEHGTYRFEIEPVSGMGEVASDNRDAKPMRLNVFVYRNDRRIITPWIYWASAL